jgi:predicted esterase
MVERTGKTTRSEFGFIPHFITSAEKGNKSATLLLLHGTGGNEQDLARLA